MGIYTDLIECPYCANDMVRTTSDLLYETVAGTCLACGFSYHSVEEQKTLREVNRLRVKLNLPTVKELVERSG